MLLQAHQLGQVLGLAFMVVMALVALVLMVVIALVIMVVIALVVLVLIMSPKIRINAMFMLNIKLVL
ncbi:hypothetical protein DPMN_104915 [Dreissena polymorpha]|uniref:Uncharacterized protein n=1 Tax=Dreissena polymorpha TaxID=45954 RepID=A0A9D4HCD5_DREPO|nr:hypothetical protein DPMN_104915 [Dreissena polymorpha]